MGGMPKWGAVDLGSISCAVSLAVAYAASFSSPVYEPGLLLLVASTSLAIPFTSIFLFTVLIADVECDA